MAVEVGKTFSEFLVEQKLSEYERAEFVSNTKRIFQRAHFQSLGEENCQLVVGQVQSGKTMSFTGLIALARDNRVPLTIVIAGTKKNLFSQSEARLRKDLHVDGDGGANPWRLIPKPDQSHAREVADAIKDWQSSDIPDEFLKTTLLVVLKSKAGLEKAAKLLAALSERIDMSEVPVLIVDDEADQASLNTKASKNLKDGGEERSGVYAALTQLRTNAVRHAFVMYTATPQAPLLISIADHLSPRYVTVLTPGEEYLGGAELFDGSSAFAKAIDEDDLAAVTDPGAVDSPPRSLRDALAFFMLSLAVAQERRSPRPLSMMIHPSSAVDTHDTFDRWTTAIVKNDWAVSLSDKSEDAFWRTLREDFMPALDELLRTTELPARWAIESDKEVLLEDMLFNAVRYWIKNVEIRKINGENVELNTNQWPHHPGWILIGGNKLERGFTVQNLATTYMPRGKGVGNADVMQQRGRFFGYKRNYRDLLRAWLSQETIESYLQYVEHEEEMHNQLRTLDRENKPVSEWRRKFLLDKGMKICRTQVQGVVTAHERLGEGFVFRQGMLVSDLAQCNDDIYLQLVEHKSAASRIQSDMREDRNCVMTRIPLDKALSWLADWHASDEEKLQIDRLLYAIQARLDSVEHLDVNYAALVFMDMDANFNQVIRRRELNETPTSAESKVSRIRIKNLFQGKNPKNGPVTYPGDDQMLDSESLTIQVHLVQPHAGGVDYEVVPALAIALPAGFSKGVVWQLD